MKHAVNMSLSALLLVLLGCSSSDKPANGEASNGVKMNGTCPTNSGFAGDDMCLPPPDPSEGFQLHYGPSDYSNPDEVAKFVLHPGQETNDCFFQLSGNTTDQYYSGVDFQMRPGSHHLIGQSRPEHVPTQGFADCGPNDGIPAGLFAGSQVPKFDDRTGQAPENAGFARLVPAQTQAVINFHVINATNEDTLREAWLNYYYIPADQVKAQPGAIDLNGGLGYYIEPGVHKTYPFSCSPPEKVRILNLGTHMHAHAKRMTIYKVSGGTQTKVLEGYSWEDPTYLYYDTIHQNTPADPTTQTPGGDFSGDLYLDTTDTLQWECEVDNTSSNVLTFRNEVNTGEMCLVTGSVVSATDPTKVVDFVCNRN